MVRRQTLDQDSPSLAGGTWPYMALLQSWHRLHPQLSSGPSENPLLLVLSAVDREPASLPFAKKLHRNVRHTQTKLTDLTTTTKNNNLYPSPNLMLIFLLFSASVVSVSLRPGELQHTRLPCPSPSPGVCSNSCPSSPSSSVVPFSSGPQSFPASGSLPMSRFLVGWHHRLHGHEFEQTPGDGEGQGSLACCMWGHKESDTTERLNNHNLMCVFTAAVLCSF